MVTEVAFLDGLRYRMLGNSVYNLIGRVKA